MEEKSHHPLLLLSISQDMDLPSLFLYFNSLLLTPTTTSSPPFFSTSLNLKKPTTSLNSTSSKPTSSQNISPLTRASIGGAAGAIAGALTYTVLLPLDAIKTVLQSTASSYTSSALDAAAAILKTHGPLGFYRGLSAVALGSASSSAVYFGTCELFKSLLHSVRITGGGAHQWFPLFMIPPLAGAMGNIASSGIMVPKELVTQRIQSGAACGRSWQVFLQILQNDGFLGLYAGYTATLLRNLPTGVLSYSSFEYLKAFVLQKNKKANLEPAESVICGALAGAISSALTTPLDVVKTRLMTQVRVQGSRTVVGTMREIVAEEGLVGLTRGIGPRVLHSACFAALGYCAFETARLAILQWYLMREKEAAEVSA